MLFAERNNNRILIILKAVIPLILIYFIIKYIKSNLDSIKLIKFEINYHYLTISFIILFLFIFNQFLLWHYITKQNKCSLAFSKTIFLRAYSEFGKYVPGKVLGYAILFHEYSKESKSKVQLSFSMFLELLAGVLSAAMLFLISLFFTEVHELKIYRFAALALLFFFFILIRPRILNLFAAWIFKIAKREPVLMNITYLSLLKTILLYSLNFMVFGIAFMLFIKSFYEVSLSNYLFITGTTAAAGLIGLFAIFVPAGLGVREGVLAFTLSFVMPPAMAGIVALTSRLWLTFAEIFLFGLIYLFSKSKRIKMPQEVSKEYKPTKGE